MTQEPLFKDLSDERLVALGTDVDACGGEKVVGVMLYPKLAPDTAARRVANALNPKQKHAFTDAEVRQIQLRARREVGRSRLFEYDAAELMADIKWISQEEQIERKEAALEKLLGQVYHELQELKSVRKGGK